MTTESYPALFVDVSTEAEEGVSDADILGPFGVRARLVQLTSAAFEDVERINLNLFPTETMHRMRFSASGSEQPTDLVAILERRNEEGDASVRLGTLEDDPDSTLSIATVDNIVSLTLSSPRYGLFETTVFSEQARIYVLRELNEDDLPDCGVGQEQEIDDSERGNDGSEQREYREAEEEAEESAIDINLLVVYTTAARKAIGGATAMRARIMEAVRRGNKVLSNSALDNIRINLVHTEELPSYRESPGKDGFYTMRDQLRYGTATGLTDLHALRNRVGADMVSLFVANTSLGGLAYIMHGVSSDFADRAYNVVYYGVAASTWTLIHELGHNFGCCHEPGCNRSVREYAKGHSFNAGAKSCKTVMVRKKAPGDRIPFFSNPNVNYKDSGVATGVANMRDNARAIRTAAATVAAFR